MTVRRFLESLRATTSIEFAIVAPILCAFVVAALWSGVALWTRNIVSEVVAESARCLAVGAGCATTAAACGDGSAACFVVNLAADRGLSSVAPSNVTIDRAATINGTSFTTVTIVYPFSILGIAVNLSSTGRFPNVL